MDGSDHRFSNHMSVVLSILVSAILGGFFCLFFYMVLSFMHFSHFIPFIIASANICCQDKAC